MARTGSPTSLATPAPAPDLTSLVPLDCTHPGGEWPAFVTVPDYAGGPGADTRTAAQIAQTWIDHSLPSQAGALTRHELTRSGSTLFSWSDSTGKTRAVAQVDPAAGGGQRLSRAAACSMSTR